jgi:type IV pilus assembly protein PilC
MPQFLIKAADDRGQLLQQTEQAESEHELREKLRQRGLLVYSVQSQRGFLQGLRTRRQRIPTGTFLLFNQQFITLIKAGLPIPRALELLATRSRSQRLVTVLKDVQTRVRNGEALSQAFKDQPGIADVYTTTLMAGERSGNLEEVLSRYVQYQRLAHSVKRRLISSLVYPAVLMVLVVAVLSFLVTYVVPQFGLMYASLDVQLPAITQFMLALGLLTRHYFWLFLLAAAAAIWGVKTMLRGTGLGARMDRVFLRLPLIGEIWWKYQIALFARTLSTLIVGGIPLVTALETSGTALSSKNLREGLRRTAQQVREGKSLADGLRANHVTPDLAVEMVEVGESTGALAAMLSSLADFYDEDLTNSMTAVMSLIEPAILIVVGSIVLAVLISLYLPLFSLYSKM